MTARIVVSGTAGVVVGAAAAAIVSSFSICGAALAAAGYEGTDRAAIEKLDRAVLVRSWPEALERLCRKRTGLPERVVREPTRWVALHEAPVAVDDHAEILNSCGG
jgi:hypothetical protein